MASAAVPSSVQKVEKRRDPRPTRWRAILLALGVLIIGGLIFLNSRLWPFDQSSVLESLQEASDSQVRAQRFHRTYFPYPGCVLYGVTFVHAGDSARPLITVEKLSIRTTYLHFLKHHLTLIEADGLHVRIPAFGSGQHFQSQSSGIVVREFVANGATVEFASSTPKKAPLRFDIHESTLRDVGGTGPIRYQLKVHNPTPPGEVTASGTFGNLNTQNPGETPISGEYKFEGADLGVYGGIAGILSSMGKFSGNLSHINISGTTDTPNFEVTSGGHPVHLKTEFSAYVDGMNGDTSLNHVDAHFGKTQLLVQGSVARSSNEKGKRTQLHFTSSHGRIEDLLRLFVTEPRSPMSGAVTLQADVEIPPGKEEFLRKVKLDGSFGIGGGEFSKSSTQEDVDRLSAGARGEKEDVETVLTDLKGKVRLENGTAGFSDLSFSIPGAAARLHGTYNVIDHKIDLHGQMHVLTKISNTTSGAKSLLLKVMEPFFKKRKKGEILPVRISGTYERPSFGLDLNDKKAQVRLPEYAPTRRK